MSFKIEITNVKELEKFYPRFTIGAKKVALEAAEDMVLEADKLAKDHARDKSRKPNLVTGRFFNSIHAEISRSPSSITGKIASNVNYAQALEEGSGPHIIFPRNKKALRFVIGGVAIFAKKVNHPGTPAFRVLGGAADQVVKDADKFVKVAWDREFGGGFL